MDNWSRVFEMKQLIFNKQYELQKILYHIDELDKDMLIYYYNVAEIYMKAIFTYSKEFNDYNTLNKANDLFLTLQISIIYEFFKDYQKNLIIIK